MANLTLTNHGCHDISGATLKTVVDGITLAAATDFLYMIPVANGTQIQILEVERA